MGDQAILEKKFRKLLRIVKGYKRRHENVQKQHSSILFALKNTAGLIFETVRIDDEDNDNDSDDAGMGVATEEDAITLLSEGELPMVLTFEEYNKFRSLLEREDNEWAAETDGTWGALEDDDEYFACDDAAMAHCGLEQTRIET